MRIVFLRTAAETGGEVLEYEVVGRPRGFPAQRHVHPKQSERHEVVSGALRVSMEGEYVFVDEWDVDAPAPAVFTALADARTYPDWWRPVYLDVEAGGPPALGEISRQHFKGRLPYHLRTSSRIVRFEPPHVVAAEVE